MPDSVELKDLTNKPFFEFDKSGSHKLTPTSRRKLLLYIFLEAAATVVIYINYNFLINSYPLLAPTLLGASTAALAQSLHQYHKRRFSASNIFKFVIWGLINGCTTALWIESLVTHVESVLYRILLDQLIGAPCFQLTFHALSKMWDNANLSAPSSVSSISAYFSSLKYSYCYWPFVSVAMFMFIPPNLMFLSNCIANLVWNLILSRLS